MFSAPLQIAQTQLGSTSTPASRLWAGLSRESKRLITLGFGLFLLLVAAVGLSLWNMHREALNDSDQSLAKLGIAIAEQTTRSVQAVDLVLQGLREDIARRGIATPEQFRQELQTQGLHAMLRQQDQALPQTSAFTIIGADGRLVNYSRVWPIVPADLSDRDYYQYFRNNADTHPFISRPVQNRGNGGWTVYVVRRIEGPTGNFLGMVLGALDLNYFQDFYRALTVGAGTTVTLLNQNGTALTSYPPTAQTGAKLPPGRPWDGIVASGLPGHLITDGLLAPGRRIVSVHPLTDYPLVVNVSASLWTALENWRLAVLLALLGTLAATACVVALLRTLGVQLRRLEYSETSLAERNARLETAQRYMEQQAEILQLSQEHLGQKSAALGTTLDHINQGIMMVDPDRSVPVYNGHVVEMLELPAEMTASRFSYDEVIAFQTAQGEFVADYAAGQRNSALSDGKPFVFECRRLNGRILEMQTVPLVNGGMVHTFSDVTERRASEEQVRYFAHHDDLTKLVNRVVFQQRLDQAIELADRTQRSVAVLYLDLDRFKLVNDTKGHGIGDKLLVQVAERLRGAARDIDIVARMGGDEFAIIQPLIDQPQASAKLAERLLHLIKQPFLIDGVLCTIGLSVGIAHYPEHASTASELLRNADTALYRAKGDGRGMYCVFEATMDARQQALFTVQQDLRSALALGQLEIEYQPIVDMASGAASGYEALLRWRHPTRGLVGPAEFIGIAEDLRLIIPMGLWVLETACAEAATWPGDLRISVNLSPIQFNQEDLVETLIDILARTGLEPERLTLEVTEGLLLAETDEVHEAMGRLRQLGVRLSLDDFGTAHAGFSYLRRFQFDAIKIDKSFVQDAPGQPEARAIVSAMLSIGAALNLDVIAEGVETELQLAALHGMQCKKVQGYLIGRPQSAGEIRRQLFHQQVMQDNEQAEVKCLVLSA